MPYVSHTGERSPSLIITNRIDVLYADSNWGLQNGYGSNQVYWRSRLDSGPGETATGKLEVGNLTLKNKLTLAIAGGGATNGHLKLMKIVKVSDNSTLASYTLGTLSGNANSDWLRVTTINTASWINTEIKLSFEDNDPNSSWAWMAVDLANIYCYS
ncbi:MULTISPECIES: hypothetical protein [Aerosakkonema]|uniref:hypothetical protein n=1 Tax=Aerosakkonema TaxID=1246629 RepID=UPI0035B96A6E